MVHLRNSFHSRSSGQKHDKLTNFNDILIRDSKPFMYKATGCVCVHGGKGGSDKNKLHLKTSEPYCLKKSKSLYMVIADKTAATGV